MNPRPQSADNPSHRPVVRIVGDSPARPFSLSNGERFRRCFARVGVDDVGRIDAPIPDGARVCLVRGDWLFDDGLAPLLVSDRNFALVVGQAGHRVVVAATCPAEAVPRAMAALNETATFEPKIWHDLALEIVDLSELADVAYRGNLRNRVPPYVLPLDRMGLVEVERHLFMASYKGVTDIVTKRVWPVPALAATRWCAARGISPNTVTFVSFLCVVAATVLFATGWFWLGLFFAWSMCFLDTVDGKLARVTLTSSKWGNVFDHGTDLVHPPFWWMAWYWGLNTLPFAPVECTIPATAIVLAGYVLGRAQEGVFLWAFGIEMHVWRPIDSAFRGITARRNPNLLLLMAGTACGRPDWGLMMVAIWTAISFVFHCVRIAQAFLLHWQGRPIASWLSAKNQPVAGQKLRPA